jgi:hypothetical protein
MQVTPEYLERAAALAKERPNFAAAVHGAHVSSLGLSETGNKELIRQGPALTHFLSSNPDKLNSILRLPGREQGAALAQMAENMNDADKPGEGKSTDSYIASRTKRGPGLGRNVTTEGRM